jgi:hypothetical protein
MVSTSRMSPMISKNIPDRRVPCAIWPG